MKQTNLLKTFLLLCAMVVGSNAWADVVVLSENFENQTGIPEGWSADAKGGGSTNGASTLYSGSDAHGTGSGKAQGKAWKLGTNSNPYGSVTTCALTSLSGDATLTFWARGKSAKAPVIEISGTDCTITGDGTSTTTSGSVATGTIDGLNYTQYTVNISNGSATSKITFRHAGPNDAGSYIYIDDIEITMAGEKIDPTITFNNGSVTVGKTLDLNTLFTSNSTGSVTYSITAGDANASISGSTLTGVAVGSVTVQASQAATSAYNAKTVNATITVNATPAVAITLDFSTNIFGLGEGSSNKATESHGFDYGGYTYTLAAADGYYYNTGYVMLGKSGSTLTFPAFPFNVSTIKVHGTSGASTTVTQNIFVGDEAVSTETTGAKNVINVYNIDAAYQAAGNIYVLKVTSNANTQISKIEIFGYESTPAVSAAGWATYVTKNPVRFTEGEAFAVTSVGSSVGLTAVTDVPKGEPVLLKGAGAKTAEVIESAAAITNKLAVSDGDDGVNDYVLANHGGNVGFYKWTGSALASGKVYLPASEVAGARDFIGFDDATGIANINSDAKTLFNGDFYNIAGQRVAQPTKGLYIVNGKKVIVK